MNYNVLDYPEYIIEKFWAYTDVVYNDCGVDFNACMIWNKCCGYDGYGRFWDGQKNWRSHRFIYSCFYGTIPPGMQICHTCDNPKCVNPYHLWCGTSFENRQDCVSKTRHAICDKNGNSKLTNDQVSEIIIRANLEHFNNFQEIADCYNVSRQTIGNIFTGMNWLPIFEKLELDLNLVRRKIPGTPTFRCK